MEMKREEFNEKKNIQDYKENIFIRLFNKIKNIFRKNKGSI